MGIGSVELPFPARSNSCALVAAMLRYDDNPVLVTIGLSLCAKTERRSGQGPSLKRG